MNIASNKGGQPDNKALHLLALPLELRLQIFTYALQYSPSIVTFTTAQLQGSQAEITQRLFGNERLPIQGLPEHHVPLIEPQYEPSLLSVTESPLLPAKGQSRPEECGICDYSPRPALLLVNRQIYEEIMSSMRPAQRREVSMFSLFISFPYGLHIFHAMGTHLLPGARTVQIAGTYVNDSFSRTRAAKVRASASNEDSIASTTASTYLGTFVSSVLGAQPSVRQLQLRIYYPGKNSYSTVWGDEASPIAVALKNIYAGQIQIEVWRGVDGTGVLLAARPRDHDKRSVSTVWRRLNEGTQPGQRPPGRWVVDDAWPETPWVTQEGDAIHEETYA